MFCIQIFFYLIKMCFAFLAEIIQHNRRILCNFRAYRRFAVQYTHRISFQSVPAGVAEFFLSCAEIFLECLMVFRTAGGAADGIDFKAYILNTECVKHGFCKTYDFSISQR